MKKRMNKQKKDEEYNSKKTESEKRKINGEKTTKGESRVAAQYLLNKKHRSTPTPHLK